MVTTNQWTGNQASGWKTAAVLSWYLQIFAVEIRYHLNKVRVLTGYILFVFPQITELLPHNSYFFLDPPYLKNNDLLVLWKGMECEIPFTSQQNPTNILAGKIYYVKPRWHPKYFYFKI